MIGHLLKLGRYEIIEQVATGGMASVFKAKLCGDFGFEKTVALKILHQNLSGNKEFVDMFIDEGKIGAELNHPNIITTLDFGEIDGYYFLALEYFEGISLNEIMNYYAKKKQKISLKIFLYIIIEVLKGLVYAHQKCDKNKNPLNIVHRDISPHNILIGFDGSVKLCDFGIAKGKHRSNLTQAGVIKGKISYMSPEQLRGEKIDQRSDIYSLGIVMLEILTAKGLFDEIEEEDIIREKILGGEIEYKFDEEIPEEIISVIKKTTSKKLEDRFQSSREILNEFIKINRSYGEDITSENIKEFFSNFRSEIKKTKKNKKNGRMENADKEPSDSSLKSARIILYIASLLIIIALIFEILSINVIK